MLNWIAANPWFALSTAALIGLALLFVLHPLLATTRAQRTLQRRRKALLELEGELDPEVFRDRMQHLEQAGREAQSAAPVRWPAALLALGIPVAVVLIYARVGTPDGLLPPAAMEQEARNVLNELASRARRNPEDTEAWLQLGRIWKEFQQFGTAEAAFRRVLFYQPGNHQAAVELAETLLYESRQPRLPDEARALVEDVLQSDPANQKALWLAGFDALQRGDGAAAADYWRRLEAVLPDGDARNLVRMHLAQIENAGPTGRPGNADSGNPETVDAAASDTAAARIELDLRLAPGLAQQPVDGMTLFVFARPMGGPPMPIAVERHSPASLPARIVLDDQDLMTPGRGLAQFGEVEVVARLSRSGQARAQPGDLEGRVAGVDPTAGNTVTLVIDTVVGAGG